MRSETVTTVLEAPQDEVFGYLSRIENLPEWANEFARELEWRDGDAVIVNGLGEFVFRIEADEETGVIDMLAGPSANELAVFPTRVVSLAPGRSLCRSGSPLPRRLRRSRRTPTPGSVPVALPPRRTTPSIRRWWRTRTSP